MPLPRPTRKQLTKPIKQREDNVTAVRMFSLLSSYTGEVRYREIAEAGMGYLTSPPILDAFGFLPDVLLAEDELRNEPVHVTIVGAKDDPRSAALYRAALAYPLANKRAEWWDKREGKLANADVDYPDFPDGPAAFACTSTFCSYPVTEPAAIPAQLDSLKARPQALKRAIAQKMSFRAQIRLRVRPKCRRIAVRTWHGRYSLSGDSIKANTRRGVFRVKTT